MVKQSTVIALSPLIARQLRDTVEHNSAYRDISEFVEVAVSNQLALETASEASPQDDEGVSSTSEADLSPVARRSGRRIAQPDPDGLSEPLSPFTNRLFPTKLACRVLANCEPGVSAREFQVRAASAARFVGHRTREEDERARRRGFNRRWIALPVGDKTSALDRFINHFSLTATRRGGATGPMVSLGLATVDGETPVLTKLGLSLAEAPSPLIDGLDELAVFGADELDLIVEAISLNRVEVDSICEFARILEATGGNQVDVDAKYLAANPSWSPARAASHRAALFGRLHDLELASTTGERGHSHISLGELPNSWTRGAA